MDALIGAARRRGLRTMEGFVLAENDAMLRLALRLGFAVTRHPEDFNLKVCRLQLRGEA
jgi:L-amino acid N-acyltransferase YncA